MARPPREALQAAPAARRASLAEDRAEEGLRAVVAAAVVAAFAEAAAATVAAATEAVPAVNAVAAAAAAASPALAEAVVLCRADRVERLPRERLGRVVPPN